MVELQNYLTFWSSTIWSLTWGCTYLEDTKKKIEKNYQTNSVPFQHMKIDELTDYLE